MNRIEANKLANNVVKSEPLVRSYLREIKKAASRGEFEINLVVHEDLTDIVAEALELKDFSVKVIKRKENQQGMVDTIEVGWRNAND